MYAKRWWPHAVVAVLLGALLWTLVAGRVFPPRPPDPVVRFAVPTQVSSGAIYVALDQGMFQAKNVDVRTRPFRLGKQALEAVLTGQADLALVADTPFVLAALSGKKIAVAAQAFASRKSMALLVRTDRGIYTADDLRGKRIGTVKGTNAEYFLDTLLTAHRLSTADIALLPMAPEAQPLAMSSGRLDAVTLWYPDLGVVQGHMGPVVKTIDSKDLFVYRMLIVGTAEYLERHAEVVGRVLAALDTATNHMHQQPDAARLLIAAAIGVEAHTLMPVFEPADFQVGLDQSLLVALGNQTSWAIGKGLVSPASTPDYKVLIRPEPLRAVLPHAVRVVF